ncbi:MAG: winged helix-turn-helix domain-containing protein [Clostridia bacterium]|nr:winged helix-turn-helix domain-containing protein [Clostridia bacterium]
MVLIVNRRKKDASYVSEIFHYMGILSHGATPSEALSEISLLYRAVIIMEPDTLPDACDFVSKLRSYASEVPIFALADGIDTFSHKEIFDGVYKFSTYSSILAYNIAQYSKKNSLSCVGDYRLAGINAMCDAESVTYFGEQIPLTKTETMILRFLIRAYPLPMDSESILRYAFRPSRSPEPASIRTHICSINKKFRLKTSRNVIALAPKKGYVVITPEVMADRNLWRDGK